MWLRSFAYVAPQLGVVLLAAPIAAVLGGIYAKYYGLSLTAIATVMLVARLFDAVTDPLIGYYSDRRRVQTGTRKPFMLIGSVTLVPCSYFLFVPHEGVSIAYFAFWYMAFYLALTTFVIPYMAWANEFTETSEDKTLVFSVMGVVNAIGGALFYVLPLLPFFSSTEVTPEILRISVILGLVFLIPGLLIAFKWVPDGPARTPLSKVDGAEAAVSTLSPVQQYKEVLAGLMNNQPFTLYVMAFMSLGIGVGLWLGLFFIYVDSYLKLGSEFAELSLWGMLVGALAIPLWYRLALRWGKRETWLIGMALLVLVFVSTGLLRPGLDGLNALFAVNILMTFALGSMNVIAYPMLCDTIDYGRLKDGAERSALYFSIQALMTKVQLAIGGAMGFAVVGWFGFDMQAPEQTEWSLIGLRLSVSWAPTFFVLLAMVFIAKMPLTEAKMKIIRHRLKVNNRGP
jgi:Na+/melibiose symporter-like transporter